jgi:methyl-accepting chemotaxis protein
VKILRRKRFVIDKKLQFSFLLVTISYIGILIAVITVSLFAPLVFRLRDLDADSVEASEAAIQILYLNEKYWLPVIFTLIFVALYTLYETHKIAGPIYRFRGVFQAIKGGTLPKSVRLRKGDYLIAEMDALNAMLESLRTQVGQLQSHAAKLHETTTQYGSLVGNSGTNATADELWNEIQKTENQLLQVIGSFRIET